MEPFSEECHMMFASLAKTIQKSVKILRRTQNLSRADFIELTEWELVKIRSLFRYCHDPGMVILDGLS